LHSGKKRRVSAAGAGRTPPAVPASDMGEKATAVAGEQAAGASAAGAGFRAKQGVTPGGSVRGSDMHSSRSLGIRHGKHLGLKPQPRRSLNQAHTAIAAPPTSAHAAAAAVRASGRGKGSLPVVGSSRIDLPAATYKGIPFPALSALCFVGGSGRATGLLGTGDSAAAGTTSGAGGGAFQVKHHKLKHKLDHQAQVQQEQQQQQEEGLVPLEGSILLVGSCEQGLVAVWDVARRQLLTSAYPFTGGLHALLPLVPPVSALIEGSAEVGSGGWGPLVLLAQVENEESSRSGQRASATVVATTAPNVGVGDASSSGAAFKGDYGQQHQRGSSLVPLMLSWNGAVLGAAYPLPQPVVAATVAVASSRSGSSSRAVAALLQNGELLIWDAFSGAVEMKVQLTAFGVRRREALDSIHDTAWGGGQGPVGIADLGQSVVLGDKDGCLVISY
jgi:hypothetical protein